MRVATYNIHRGWGMDGRYRPGRIIDVIAELGVDVIALQEAQHYFRRGTDMLDGNALCDALGLRPLAVAQKPMHTGWRGNMLLVARHARVLRPPVGLRLGGLEPRGAIMAELDLGRRPFRVLATHLSLGMERRRRQALLLLAAMREGVGAPMPTLLLGDLNERRHDRGALDVLCPVFGRPQVAPTFPAFRPFFSLDRILGDWPGLVAMLSVHDSSLARRSSDHLPLLAEVNLCTPAPHTAEQTRAASPA